LVALPLVTPVGRARQAASMAAFLGTLVVLGFGYNAGRAGGELVYKHGAAQVYASQPGVSAGSTNPTSASNDDSDSD
jgi:hypothetical protein